MNPPPRARVEAKLIYGTPEFEIVKGGDHVVCAVSGAVIPLEQPKALARVMTSWLKTLS